MPVRRASKDQQGRRPLLSLTRDNSPPRCARCASKPCSVCIVARCRFSVGEESPRLTFPGTGGNAHLVLDRAHLENNVIALSVNASNGTPSGIGVHVIIRDSVVSGNAVDGILALTTAGKAPAFIVVDRTSVVDNAGTGIHADGPRATMVLNDNVISRNGTGISALNGGQLISFGNNKNFNNIGPEGAPTGFFSPM